MLVQVYEVSTPEEARPVSEVGADHVGVLVGKGRFGGSFRWRPRARSSQWCKRPAISSVLILKEEPFDHLPLALIQVLRKHAHVSLDVGGRGELIDLRIPFDLLSKLCKGKCVTRKHALKCRGGFPCGHLNAGPRSLTEHLVMLAAFAVRSGASGFLARSSTISYALFVTRGSQDNRPSVASCACSHPRSDPRGKRLLRSDCRFEGIIALSRWEGPTAAA